MTYLEWGYQVGGKWFDVFNLKNSWVMLEYNNAVPYLYTNTSENIIQNYSHVNQEIAHPLGASFNEVVAMIHFEKNRLFASAKCFYAKKKRYGGLLYGENIFLANDDVLATVVPEKINWTYFGAEFGYNLNIKTRMQLFGRVNQRSEWSNSWKK